MRYVVANSLSIIGCELGILAMVECSFEKVLFPVGQIHLGDLNKCRLVVWSRKWRFNQLWDSSVSRSEAKRQEIETLKFLLERTDVVCRNCVSRKSSASPGSKAVS